jgi:hypothetical protein
MLSTEQLVLQAKSSYQAKDYETCMTLTNEALRASPGNTEAAWLMKEARRQWEDQRSLEQLEIYVENLKKEAMDLFDMEQYEQCLGMFRFLSELEPENHTLRDYVRLSQQMFVETIGSRAPTASEKDALSSDPSLTKTSEAPALGSLPPETHNPTHLPLAPMPQFGTNPPESDSKPVVSELAAPKSAILEAEGIPQSVNRKIIQDYLAATRPARRSRLWNLGLTAALLLATMLGAASFWIHSSLRVSRIEIQSTPEKAVVFIDNERIGETPLRNRDILTGSHALRLEKSGYQPHRYNLVVERAQAIVLAIQLEKAKAGPSSIQSTAAAAIPTGSSAAQPEVPDPIEPETTPAPQPAISDPIETEMALVQIAQSVIHHHLLGSCTGRLKIDGDRISFWSSGNSQDAFTRKINQITNVQLGEKLLIEFGDNAYRFEALARDPRGNRRRLGSFYEQIKLQKSPRRSPL